MIAFSKKIDRVGIKGLPNLRVTIFSLNLGLSFAVLVLYIPFLEAIALVVLLLTASVVAATKADLTELRSDRIYVIIIVSFAIAVFVSAAYLSAPFNQFLFYILISLNFGLLLAYIGSRLSSSRN